MVRPPPPIGAVCLLLAAATFLAGGCATRGPDPDAQKFDFFGRTQPTDAPWFEEVSAWQERAREDHPHVSIRSDGPVEGPESEQLRGKLYEFEAEERIDLARKIALWARLEGRKHYVADEGEELLATNDYWPTYSELVETNGDDCDGLDLIAYQLLREFGFPQERLFRAILMRNRDEANHMVTLWFEDPEDPWVFDATGATTREFIRFSEVQGWTPTHVFNETEQFHVIQRNVVDENSPPPFAALSRERARP